MVMDVLLSVEERMLERQWMSTEPTLVLEGVWFCEHEVRPD